MHTVIEAQWPTCKDAISKIRRDVFITEQQVPEELEWDDLDATAKHLLIFAVNTNDLLAYARLLPQGKLTRMAVRKDQRRKGLGAALVTHACRDAGKQGLNQIYLDAQIEAKIFYEKLGFVASGEAFMDAGIKHIRMHKNVAKNTAKLMR